MPINDKILHFGVAFILGLFSVLLKDRKLLRWLVWVSIFSFFGKEVYDVVKFNATGFSYLDIFADFFGLFFGLFIGNHIPKRRGL
jgi:hypothetical protein